MVEFSKSRNGSEWFFNVGEGEKPMRLQLVCGGSEKCLIMPGLVGLGRQAGLFALVTTTFDAKRSHNVGGVSA